MGDGFGVCVFGGEVDDGGGVGVGVGVAEGAVGVGVALGGRAAEWLDVAGVACDAAVPPERE